MVVKQYSAEVYDLDVSDDATEDNLEPAARERLQESDWQEDHNRLLKIRCVEASNTPSSCRVFDTEATMPTYWATIEITRSAFAEVEAENAEEAHEKVIERLEEGEIQGWEEDVPQIRLEDLPEDDA